MGSLKNSENELIESSLNNLTQIADVCFGDIFSNIPIINPVYNSISLVKKTFVNFQNESKIRKLVEFLDNLNNLNYNEQKKLKKFMKSNIEGSKNLQKVGELVLEIVTNYDDIRKAGLLGKIIEMTLKNQKNQNNKGFIFKIAYYINNVFFEDFEALKIFVDKKIHKQRENESLEDLCKNGFLNNLSYINNNIDSISNGNRYYLNKYGVCILKCLYNIELDLNYIIDSDDK